MDSFEDSPFDYTTITNVTYRYYITKEGSG
nr:MAG TPA: hypothetical protein [Caudoviricetes sp.]